MEEVFGGLKVTLWIADSHPKNYKSLVWFIAVNISEVIQLFGLWFYQTRSRQTD